MRATAITRINCWSWSGSRASRNRYPHQLSGGMRQRAALCRALVCDVPLLLMDEPFGALDALSREEHQLLLQDVWLGDKKTVVFVTHDINEAVMLSDRVLIMTARPGRVSEIVTIDLPRPRDPEMVTAPQFNSCVKRIRNNLFSRRKSLEESPARDRRVKHRRYLPAIAFSRSPAALVGSCGVRVRHPLHHSAQAFHGRGRHDRESADVLEQRTDDGLGSRHRLPRGDSCRATLGTIVASWEFLGNAIYPVLIATQVMPKVAIAPILIIWFGFGVMPKIVLTALIAFFPS